MTDFLLEILSEEIPARMQAGARADLERLFAAQLADAGLKAEGIETWSTPRRLVLIARGLPLETEAVREERRGPRADAPDKAIQGFLGSTGLTRDQLEEREEKKGRFLFAVIDKPGRATADVLAEAIPAVIRAFPWPKSMRWGAESASTSSLRWVRPLQGIVAILGEALVPCAIGGIAAGVETVGHRFHHPGCITIGGAGDYAEKLRACHVIVDQAEREAIIRDGAKKVAADAGLELVEDEGLVVENAGLTEWPVPLLGGFDPAFLDVPEEVIQLTARAHQKYFVLRNPPRNGEGDHANHGGGGSQPSESQTEGPLRQPSGLPPPRAGEEGALAPNFVCTANIEAADGGKGVVAGNEKVLAARLSDAKFFWEQDRKTPLAEHAEKLAGIVFHEKLGTVADKVERVAKLARWLVEEGIVPPTPSPRRGEGGAAQAAEGEGERGAAERPPSPSEPPHPGPLPAGEREALADKAERAARLAKADLVTGMVGEFPELQGVMGGYYAAAEGLDPEIAAAIRDHYKPVGQGDEVPTAPVTVAVSLADKLDSIMSLWAAGEKPTGSKDPFALRRAAIGILRLVTTSNLRLRLRSAILPALNKLLARHIVEEYYD